MTDWREQKRRTREFLKGLELEDEDGNRISLIENTMVRLLTLQYVAVS